MNVSYRSYLTAGVSVLGAGAIALSPVQPLPAASPALAKASSTAAVNLAASIDPITPWIETFQTAKVNTTQLYEAKRNPGPTTPVLRQIIQNVQVYATELNDPQLIIQQITQNIQNAIKAPLDEAVLPSGVSGNINNTIGVTCVVDPNCGVDAATKWQTTYLLTQLGSPELAALVPIANTLSTPLMGAILGWAGPGLGAIAQTIDTVNAVTTAIKAQDWTAALNEVINYPAYVTNAVLNGGEQLDVTQVVGAIASQMGITLPAGTKVGIATGGFLSPAVALGGTDPAGTTPLPFRGWGGVAWDSVSLEANVGGIGVWTKGTPVGNSGTQYGLKYAIANAIKVTPPLQRKAASAVAAAPAAASNSAAAPTAARKAGANAPKAAAARNKAAR